MSAAGFYSPEFRDYDHFISRGEFLDYVSNCKLPKTYMIKFDPEKKRKVKKEYWNVPCSFDIETTSFLYNGAKCATMYLWGFNLNGRSIYGRTWEEFLGLLELLREILNTLEIRLIIWVHNLSYEFQFMRKWIPWDRVFALKDHEVARALSSWGIEFRCSLLESGKRLSLLADEIKENPVRKLATLNYRGLRHSKTPLTDLELMYQLNDVRIVSNYIYEKGKRRYGGIPNILMTKTGYVREQFRKNTIWNKNTNIRTHYRNLIRELTMEVDEYLQAQDTFQGGYVHGNALYIDDVLRRVGSFDIISDYPFQIVANQYPMSKGTHIAVPTPEEVEKYTTKYLSMFKVEFFNIRRRPGIYDDVISESHCTELEEAIKNNGRVKSAKHLKTMITSVDYEIYKNYYEWDAINITDLWYYIPGYLPTPFIEVVLELYNNKTKLKGIPEEEDLYMLSKENLNSAFGMMVMRILRAVVEYIDGEYIDQKVQAAEIIDKENRNPKRFTFYMWGLFVTAWARKTILLDAIKPSGKDHVYSDTDSEKVLNPEKHLKHFNEYNKTVREKLNKALDYHKIPREMAEPKTKKGVSKLLGAFEYEHGEKPYDLFKTLGAKRYMCYDYSEDHLETTIAGLGKKSGSEFINKETVWIEEQFDFFTNDMDVPPEETGKLTHTYIDDEINAELTDCFGEKMRIYEKSAIHLDPAPFHLSLAEAFLRFLQGYEGGYGLYGQD